MAFLMAVLMAFVLASFIWAMALFTTLSSAFSNSLSKDDSGPEHE